MHNSMEINVDALKKPTYKPESKKIKKPALKINIGKEGVTDLKEIIIKNFNRCSTEDVIGYFNIFYFGETSKIVIDISTFKVLDSVFRTTGRLPEEMCAIFKLQTELINNISKLREKSGLLEFLNELTKNEDKVIQEIADTLISLCKN